jgi:hypothetical protein
MAAEAIAQALGGRKTGEGWMVQLPGQALSGLLK